MDERNQPFGLSVPWECTEPAMGRLLAAYEWGLLDSAEEEQFEEHVLRCAACAAELSSSWDVGAGIRAQRRNRRRFAWLSVGVAAAAAAIFIVLQVGNVTQRAARPVTLTETEEAVFSDKPASWTFELDIPNSNSFSFDLDVPGSS